MEAFAQSLVGRTRANHDAALCAEFFNRAGVYLRLIALADGLSQSPRGEWAADHCLSCLHRFLQESDVVTSAQLKAIALDRFFAPLNDALLSAEDAGQHPSTTLTAVVVFPTGSLVLQVGNPRAFFFAADGSECVVLTKDPITPATPDNPAPRATLRTSGTERWLGDPADRWKPDLLLDPPALQAGDGHVIVASDGLHDVLPADLLLSLYNQSRGDLPAFCSRCVQVAHLFPTSRGDDNTDDITMAVLRLHTPTPATLSEPIRAGGLIPTGPVEAPAPVPFETSEPPLPPRRRWLDLVAWIVVLGVGIYFVRTFLLPDRHVAQRDSPASPETHASRPQPLSLPGTNNVAQPPPLAPAHVDPPAPSSPSAKPPAALPTPPSEPALTSLPAAATPQTPDAGSDQAALEPPQEESPTAAPAPTIPAAPPPVATPNPFASEIQTALQVEPEPPMPPPTRCVALVAQDQRPTALDQSPAQMAFSVPDPRPGYSPVSALSLESPIIHVRAVVPASVSSSPATIAPPPSNPVASVNSPDPDALTIIVLEREMTAAHLAREHSVSVQTILRANRGKISRRQELLPKGAKVIVPIRSTGK